jgi:hypothetical protein
LVQNVSSGDTEILGYPVLKEKLGILDDVFCLWLKWRFLRKYLLRSFCTSIRYTVGALHRVVMG